MEESWERRGASRAGWPFRNASQIVAFLRAVDRLFERAMSDAETKFWLVIGHEDGQGAKKERRSKSLDDLEAAQHEIDVTSATSITLNLDRQKAPTAPKIEFWLTCSMRTEVMLEDGEPVTMEQPETQLRLTGRDADVLIADGLLSETESLIDRAFADADRAADEAPPPTLLIRSEEPLPIQAEVFSNQPLPVQADVTASAPLPVRAGEPLPVRADERWYNNPWLIAAAVGLVCAVAGAVVGAILAG